MGKTSLMKEASQRLKSKYLCLYADMEHCQNPEDAVAEIALLLQSYQKLWNKAKILFKNAFKGIKKTIGEAGYKDFWIKIRADLTAGDWKEKADELFKILATVQKPVVIFLDEVPVLINNMLKDSDNRITPEGKKRTAEFMHWIRSKSLAYQGKIRIVIAGSIGLTPVLSQANLSAAINNFTPFELKPWDTNTALGCLKALALNEKIKFQKGAAEKALELLKVFIPHHVQMFFDRIYETCKQRENMHCSVDDVKKFFEKEMLGPKSQVEWRIYEERLNTVLGKENFSLALDLLNEAAVESVLSIEAMSILATFNTGKKDNQKLLREIMDILIHDGYLKETKKGYIFVAPLLKKWWQGRYKAYYIPAGERS
jgi:hypothetical protein